jgi:hypothetical protein
LLPTMELTMRKRGSWNDLRWRGRSIPKRGRWPCLWPRGTVSIYRAPSVSRTVRACRHRDLQAQKQKNEEVEVHRRICVGVSSIVLIVAGRDRESLGPDPRDLPATRSCAPRNSS